MYKLKKIVFNGRIGFVLGFLSVIFSAAIEVLKTESQKTLINGIVRSDAIDALIIKVLSMLLVFSAGSIMFYITGRIFQRVSFFQCKKRVSNLSEKIQRIKAEHLEISYIGNMEAIYTDIDELGTRMYQMSNNCVNIIHTIMLFGMLFLIGLGCQKTR